MRISGSDLPQGTPIGGQSNGPRQALAEAAPENHQTADLLAISAAATAVSSNAGRVQQLKLQVDSGEYLPSSVGIAQRLITGALARSD